MRRSAPLFAFALSACGVGTTGGEIVDFPAAAAGPSDVRRGEPLAFTTDRGWQVVLDQATIHIGAIYLNQAMPVSGAQNTSCILPGTYVVQETYGRDVDLLDPAPQLFPAPAHGTTLPALAAQVWLTGADVNAADDATPILVVRGTASDGGATIPFEGTITIGANRRAAAGGLPGAYPLCKQRIVSPIPTDVVVRSTGGLLLRIDPRQLFVNVDFGKLPKSGDAYVFSDDPGSDAYGQPSINLYANLRSSGALWTFSWDATL